MFFDFVEHRRFKAAARQYALRLWPQLLQDYGASESYSPKQIEKSVARAGLPAKYIAFGYALYLEEATFNQMGNNIGAYSYAELRALLKPLAARTPSSGFEPAGECSDAINLAGGHNIGL